MKSKLLLAATVVALTIAPAHAQTAGTQVRDRLGQILGTIFGVGANADTSLDVQWRAGRTPLANQRVQFNSKVDADIRSGALNSATGSRLKADYAEIVALEARYGADGQFTTAERSDLSSRYTALTQAINDGGYTFDPATAAASAEVKEGQVEFNRRVDASVTARRISRTAATRLKSDYSAVIQIESDYLRDGLLSESERDDLDARLDALDVRLGDVAYVAPVQTPRARLDSIARALPTSGLTAAAQTQLRVEHADLMRLEAAYARLTVTADERAYLDRRLAELEARARVAR